MMLAAMQTFVDTLILGISAGTLDAVLALGIVLIYRTTGVLNFALAAIGTFAAYVIYSVAQGRPLWVALVAGLAVGAALGATTYLVVRGIHARHYALAAAVATLAVAILLDQAVRQGWGIVGASFPNPFPLSPIKVGEYSIPYQSAAAVVCAAAIAVLSGAALRWTRVGTMVRAISDDPQAAQVFGGNVAVLVAGVWALAGAFAAVAGFFAAQQVSFEPVFLEPIFVGALIAAVIGGLRSLNAAFGAAILLEVARSLYNLYAPDTISPYAQTFLLILLIAVLVLAPRRWLAQNEGRTV